MRNIGLLLGLVLAAASPARSAENLACATDAMDEQANKSAFAAYRADEDIGEALKQSIGAVLEACIASEKWSVQAIESTSRVMIGQILVRGVLAELAAFNIPAEALERSVDGFLASLSQAELRKFVDGEVTDEMGVRMIARAIADGVVSVDNLPDKLAGLVGEYAAGRGNVTYFTAQFAQQ
jgi:hypothetical protein